MTLNEQILYRTCAYRAPAQPWPEIASARTVLDFGGGFGVHYKQALVVNPNIRWAVVECVEVVHLARTHNLETKNLQFFTSISEAMLWLRKVDVIHCNAALQYCLSPADKVAALTALGARTMLWHRIILSPTDEVIHNTQDSRRIHHGPAQPSLFSRIFDRRKVYQPVTLMPAKDFLAAHSAYDIEIISPRNFRMALK